MRDDDQKVWKQYRPIMLYKEPLTGTNILQKLLSVAIKYEVVFQKTVEVVF